MTTNWKELAAKIGSLHQDGESGGEDYAEKALEEILGQEWIEDTVEHSISFKPGREIAMNCLRYIRSKKAVQYAYCIYKNSEGERASQAVWLIKHIAHPISFNWIKEFLSDDNVMDWGIGVLDKLLWEKQIQYSSEAEALLLLAEQRSELLKPPVKFIREYLNDRLIN